MDPVLTVVMPVFNGVERIRRAVISVLDADVESLELFVVDDGSTDGSGDIARKVISSRTLAPGVTACVIDQSQNLGYGAATNTALSRARGEWIFFVDSDDTVEPTIFRRLINKALSHDALIAVPRYRTVHEETGNDGVLRQWFPPSGVSTGVEAVRRIFRRELFASQHVLVHSSLWSQTSSPTDNAYSDFIVMSDLYSRSPRVAYLDEPLYNLHIHSASTTGSVRPSTWDLTELPRRTAPVIDRLVAPSDARDLKRNCVEHVSWVIIHKCALEPEPTALAESLERWARSQLTVSGLGRSLIQGQVMSSSVLTLAKVAPRFHRRLYRRYKSDVKGEPDGALLNE